MLRSCTDNGRGGGGVNCGKVENSVQSNLLPSNEPEVENMECIRCSSVLDLPKATVTHDRSQ